MPTKENENFIPRNSNNPGVEKILGEYSTALDEIVNFGSNVFCWSSEKIHGGEELAPLFFSFRHIFEVLDAISILVKYSSIEPCKILLRSAFESVLNIKYILQKDPAIRGRDFMTCYWHVAITNNRKADPDDCTHKELLAIIHKNASMKNFRFPEIPNVKNILKILTDHLASAEYAEAEQEYQRLLKLKDRKPNWYSMHGGPSNIIELAEAMDSRLEYELLYREWSGLVHGFDIIMNNVEVVDYGKVLASQIRLPTNAYDIICKAIQYGLEIIPPFIKYIVPEKMKEAQEWYDKEYITMKKSVLLKNRIIVR